MEGNYKRYFIEKQIFHSFFFKIVVGYLNIVKIQMKFVVIGRKYQLILIFFSHMVHPILFWINQLVHLIWDAKNYLNLYQLLFNQNFMFLVMYMEDMGNLKMMMNWEEHCLLMHLCAITIFVPLIHQL